MQRVVRMLNETDQARYAELFAPYLQGHSGHYIYRLKREDYPAHLQRIGEHMQLLLDELRPAYGQEPAYAVLVRVFGEHFQVDRTGCGGQSRKRLERSKPAIARMIWKPLTGRRTAKGIRATAPI